MSRVVPFAAAALASAALLSACSGSSSPKAAAVLAPSTAAAATTVASASAPSSMPTDMPTDMPSMAMPSTTVDASTAATDAAQSEPVVHIKDFAFSAPSKPIAAGTMFMVINDDSTAHTYEDVKHAFDSGTIKPGATKEVKAPAAGTYSVKCDFHPSMHGTLTVTS